MATIKMKSQLFHYAALVTDVYDGDTITVDIDLGVGIWRKGQKIRFWKVDTPEVKGAEKVTGLKVRDFVQEMLLGKEVLLRTILDKRGVDSTGKFGRLLGEIFVENAQGQFININDLLLTSGFARPLDEDGSAPREVGANRGVQPAQRELPTSIVCRYCGQERVVDPDTQMVESCPNCLDQAFPAVRAL